MRYDFVVIGAGISGIASAITLAQNGHQVALLEKANRTAPLLRGFSRRGVHFDTGFHYTGGLGAGEPLDTFFRYLGLSNHLSCFPIDEDGFDLFSCESHNFEFRIPSGYARLRQRLCETFPNDCKAIVSYLSQIRAASTAMPYPSATYCWITSESIAVNTMSVAMPASRNASSMWLRPVNPRS